MSTPNARPPQVGRFLFVEPSDASFELDGLKQLTVVSPALGGRGDVTVWVPPGHENATDLPLVILLHGVYGSHWCWSAKAGAHRVARRLIEAGEIAPCVLAMPSDGLLGEGSGYVNHPGGPDVADWIADDVPDAISACVACVSDASPRYITGLSMGGFGALRLGATRPDRFAAFGGMSSLIELAQMDWCTHDGARYADWPVPEEATLLNAMLANRDTLCPFIFDCGSEDYLFEANQQFSHALHKAELPHTFSIHEGAHEWSYWENHLSDHLRFFHTIETS